MSAPLSTYEETVQRGAEEVARLVGAARPQYATPDEALEQSEDWTSKQLVCRVKGHRFTVPMIADEVVTPRWRYIYTEVGCEGGCGVVQLQEMNTHGHVYWANLRYPPEYLSRHGRVVGDAKDALRVKMVRTQFKPRQLRSNKHEPHNGYEQAALDFA